MYIYVSVFDIFKEEIVFFNSISISLSLVLYLMFPFFLHLGRFLGSAKISLRDLATGHVRSLPSKNVPLANESGQNIGVSLFPLLIY